MYHTERQQGDYPVDEDRQCKPSKRMGMERSLQVAVQEKGNAVSKSATRTKGKSQPV